MIANATKPLALVLLLLAIPAHAATIYDVETYDAICNGTTDDTAAINAALNAARQTGGIVRFPAKACAVTSIDATELVSVDVVGSGGGINGGKGTRIIPLATTVVLDLTGSAGVTVKDIQIGETSTIGQVGILLAQVLGSPGSTLISLINVHVTGDWTAAALYVYGVGDSRISFSRFWKLGQGAAVVWTRDNVYGIQSPHVPIAQDAQNGGNWFVTASEFHEFPGMGIKSGGTAIMFQDVLSMSFAKCLFDSPTNIGTIFCQGACGVAVRDSAFYTENGVSANYNLYVQGSLIYAGFNNSYTYDIAKIGGGGAVSFVQQETQ